MDKEDIIIADHRTRSHWFSCDLIKTKILNSYHWSNIWYQDEPEAIPLGSTLVVADHRWLTDKSLEAIQNFRRPMKIIFHIYGDLTVKLPLFYRQWSALKQFKIQLIVSSHEHRKLLETILPETSGKIKVETYEADPKVFKLSQDERKRFRSQYNLTGHISGYAGRICRQKGVLELMEGFLKVRSNDSKLILAGNLSPHPFWQFDLSQDDSFVKTFTKLMTLGDGSIVWIKDLEHSQMPSFYSALDEFISPSYFHDEDFGMSVSEAVTTGLPCLISRWGGHLRLLDHPNVRFINMEMGSQGVRINMQSLTSQLTQTADSTPILRLNSTSTLTLDQREILLQNPTFLRTPSGFDLELYSLLYRNYL